MSRVFPMNALRALLIWLIVLPGGAAADITEKRYDLLFLPVDAARLSHDERRFVQLSLAFGNHYLGLLDGDWGRRSQEALNRYTAREFDAAPLNMHLAALAFDLFRRVSKSGWNILYLKDHGVSLLFPFDAYAHDAPGPTFVNWHHTESSLAISAARTGLAETSGFHAYFLDQSAGAAPYTVRRDTRLVTSVRTTGGRVYARSDLVGGSWSTIVLFAKERDRGILTAVSASLAPGRSADIRFPEGGFLDRIVALFLDIANEDTSPAPAAQAAPKPQPAQPGRTAPARSSGSGFVVSDRGHVLTNAHVVEGCTRLTAGDRPARIAATSDIFDLAVLTTETEGSAPKAVFAAAPAALNADVLAAGFPLSDVLDGLNVTRGVVSSLKGLKGDSFNMQISAAVQAGNSGGPLLDAAGQVTGVVVAKLRQDFVARSTGSVPENVNFAVRGEIAKMFLAQNAIPIEIGAPAAPVDAAQLGRIASAITVLIECR